MKFIKPIFLATSILIVAIPANAHTQLISAHPEEGTTLEISPIEVRLEFSESLMLVGAKNPNRIEVTDESGAVLSGGAIVDGPKISVPIVPAVGTITVKYHVVSGDGHPVEGEYQFDVANPDLVDAPEIFKSEADSGSNLLVRAIWGLLLLSGIGTIALLRRRK